MTHAVSLLYWLSAGLYDFLTLVPIGSTISLLSALLMDDSTVQFSRQNSESRSLLTAGQLSLLHRQLAWPRKSLLMLFYFGPSGSGPDTSISLSLAGTFYLLPFRVKIKMFILNCSCRNGKPPKMVGKNFKKSIGIGRNGWIRPFLSNGPRQNS